jgi:hypothetical protein
MTIYMYRWMQDHMDAGSRYGQGATCADTSAGVKS